MVRRLLYNLLIFIVAIFVLSPRSRKKGRHWLVKVLAIAIEWMEEAKRVIFELKPNTEEEKQHNKTSSQSSYQMEASAETNIVDGTNMGPVRKDFSNVLSNDYIKQRLSSVEKGYFNGER